MSFAKIIIVWAMRQKDSWLWRMTRTVTLWTLACTFTSEIGIPVVVDHAHYLYNPVMGLSLSDAYRLALPTWKDRCPKVHLCSQSPDKKIHAHGDYISYKDYRDVYEAL
jgi:UV DNA damage repair endonuclease